MNLSLYDIKNFVIQHHQQYDSEDKIFTYHLNDCFLSVHEDERSVLFLFGKSQPVMSFKFAIYDNQDIPHAFNGFNFHKANGFDLLLRPISKESEQLYEFFLSLIKLSEVSYLERNLLTREQQSQPKL